MRCLAQRVARHVVYNAAVTLTCCFQLRADCVVRMPPADRPRRSKARVSKRYLVDSEGSSGLVAPVATGPESAASAAKLMEVEDPALD